MLINGHELNVVKEGSAASPTIFLLHHGLGSVQSWKAQVPFFVSQGFQVIAYDRWGYGSSTWRSQLSMPEFGDDLIDLKEIYNALGIRQAVLLGHSDGGTIALYFALHYPELVSCIITVAAHIYVEPKMSPGIESVRMAYETQPVFQKGLQRMHGDKTESVFYGWYNGWCKPENLGWNMETLLDGISCPVLVVQGEEDEHATPKHAEVIARRISKAELWIVPSARHMLPQDMPEAFNLKTLKFLGEVGLAAEVRAGEIVLK